MLTDQGQRAQHSVLEPFDVELDDAWRKVRVYQVTERSPGCRTLVLARPWFKVGGAGIFVFSIKRNRVRSEATTALIASQNAGLPESARLRRKSA